MAQILRQSTAVDVLIGPFIDDTDGKTAEEALALAQADIKLSKNGQALAQKTDVTAAAHDSDGYYNCELDATDTNTVGQLTLIVHESGALPVRHDYQVIEEATYDFLFASGATPLADINAEADTALSDYDPPTKAEMDTAHGLLATEAKQDIIDGIVDSILADTGTDGVKIAAGAIAAAAFAAGAIDAAAIATDAIGSAELAASAVNEIRDAILAAAMTLPGQVAPPLAPTLEEALGWLYKVLRNRTTQTATAWNLLADNESTVDAKATVSDDGTTAIKQEVVTGP